MNIDVERHIIGFTDDGSKIYENFETIHNRKIARRIARKIMKKHGIKNPCHHNVDGKDTHRAKRSDSYFSTHWKGIMDYE